ncbi:hypothetical protein [Flagellimonas lutimaris]|uniref:hypothetical protein n=1 Tax=Flagellimonas lutimaris TaxID=475082 RepID=UPI003F5CC05B
MKLIISFLVCCLAIKSVAQTNSFPNDGNVGVGTLSPQAKLQVNSTGTIGGYWNPPNSYFTLFDGSGQHLIMDTNEIYGSHTLHIGSMGSDVVRFRTIFSSGLAEDKMIIKNNGFVGVGTNFPLGMLHVTSGTSGDAVFRLEADTDNNNESDNPIIQLRQDGDIIGIDLGFSENFGENKFGIAPWNSTQGGNRWDAFVMDTGTGNIGIGTSSPGSWRLAVKGKIRAEEIKVETGWADYVFEKDYDLPTLDEVERHIREKGHLINIPTAEEVEANGVELGEMNRLLLEKVEELTLYILEQQRQIEDLEASNRRIDLLEEKMNLLLNHSGNEKN